jgi:AraC-like DNA-binding protein
MNRFLLHPVSYFCIIRKEVTGVMDLDWLKRMNDAMDLIENRMEERINIEEIAKAADSSPFHFQRMFSMFTGITVAEYVRKRKLTLAAQELAITSSKVVDVALKYGYESPESFAKAFRKIHGITPYHLPNLSQGRQRSGLPDRGEGSLYGRRQISTADMRARFAAAFFAGMPPRGNHRKASFHEQWRKPVGDYDGY